MPHDPKITTLRHEGKLTEAYKLAKDNISKNHSDDQSKFDLAWVLYDMIKITVNNKKIDELKLLVKEFDDLKIPVSENIIHENINRYRSYTPAKFIYLDAKRASIENHHEESFALYKKAFNLLPDDTEVITGLGWEYYYMIKKDVVQLIENNNPDLLKKIRINLYEFLKLRINKPSLLYSSILRIITKISNIFDNYAYFVKEWGLENFREEGYSFDNGSDSNVNNDIWRI